MNPLATISALSERSVDLIAKKNGLSIDLMSRNEPLDINSTPKVSNDNQYRQDSTELGPSSIGWQFTEALSGHIYIGPNFKHDELFEDMGRDYSCAMQMLLTIEICKNRGKTIKQTPNSEVFGVLMFSRIRLPRYLHRHSLLLRFISVCSSNY